MAESWGDLHFARDIQRALEGAGHPTRIHLRPDWDSWWAARDDVGLHLLGRAVAARRPGRLEVLWHISHPDAASVEVYEAHDVAFVASDSFARWMDARVGVPVRPLHQATDPRRFDPSMTGPHHELLFVANSRGVRRHILADLLPTTRELAVYGKSWTPERLDPRYLAGEHIPNGELGGYYASADIVLNDHWPDMQREGFLSNRLYDASAAGAFVISDGIEGLEAEFDGGVVAYEDAADLHAVIERFVADPDGRREHAARARAAVIARHTFERRIEELLAAIEPMLATRAPAVRYGQTAARGAMTGRRIVFVASIQDAPSPAEDVDVVVLDTAWTPAPNDPSGPIPLRSVVGPILARIDLYRDALDRLEAWETAAGIPDRMMVDGVSWWFRQRPFIWYSLHEHRLWLAILDALGGREAAAIEIRADEPVLTAVAGALVTATGASLDVIAPRAVPAARVPMPPTSRRPLWSASSAGCDHGPRPRRATLLHPTALTSASPSSTGVPRPSKPTPVGRSSSCPIPGSSRSWPATREPASSIRSLHRSCNGWPPRGCRSSTWHSSWTCVVMTTGRRSRRMTGSCRTPTSAAAGSPTTRPSRCRRPWSTVCARLAACRSRSTASIWRHRFSGGWSRCRVRGCRASCDMPGAPGACSRGFDRQRCSSTTRASARHGWRRPWPPACQ